MYSIPSTLHTYSSAAPNDANVLSTVAPLRIAKSPQTIAGHRQQVSFDHRNPAGPATTTIATDFTTPPSPKFPKLTRPESAMSLHVLSSSQLSQSSPTYLRALHSFRPTPTTMTESDCLSFEPDQIIQVHTLHPSGWADGTLLSTNQRGWFPSNYCEAYTLSNLRPLLGASSLLYATVRARRVSQYHTVISCVVTSVRGLLVSCNCLSKEDDLVKSEPTVKRARKYLLSELSALASLAKLTAEYLNSSNRNEYDSQDEILALGDAIYTRTERLVDRANRLLEIVTPLIDIWQEEDVYAPLAPAPATGSNAFEFVGSETPATWENFQQKGQGRETKIVTTEADSLKSMSMNSGISDDSHHYISQQQLSNSAVELLNSTHDTLLSHLAAYIGRLHLQSRSPGQINDATRQSVNAAREFLGVVKAVSSKTGVRLSTSGALEASCDMLWNKVTTLVNVAREVVASHGEFNEFDVVMDNEVKKLVEAATACVRSAGECVALGHCTLDATGDFELSGNGMAMFNRDSLLSVTGITAPIVTTQSPVVLADDGRRRLNIHVKNLSKELPAPPEGEGEDDIVNTNASVKRVPARLLFNVESPDLNIPRGKSEAYSMARSSQMTSGSLHSQDDLLPTAMHPYSGDSSRNSVRDSLPQIVEPQVDTQIREHNPQQNPQQISFLSDNSDDGEVIRFSETLEMPRASNMNLSLSSESTASSNRESDSEDNVGKQDKESVPTTPEPTTPVGFGRKPSWNELPNTVITNADGQVMGATLEGLVERMTLHDAPPYAMFSTTFYLTFRLFTTPKKLAESLVHRFCVEPRSSVVDLDEWESKVAAPIRLRVYNVFKGWLESHWCQSTDKEALEVIRNFARGVLSRSLPPAGKKLDELAQIVSNVKGPLVVRQVSHIGQGGAASAPNFVMADSPPPPAMVSKSLLAQLRTSSIDSVGAPGPTVLDFDPLELARQLTVKESKIFCQILPLELIGRGYERPPRTSFVVHTKALSSLSTHVTAWVADSILDPDLDTKKRSMIIKQWIKICHKCLKLNNYNTLWEIFCGLDSTYIQRLGKTWALLAPKYKDIMDQLRHITDTSRNYSSYRAALRGHVPPCLPFVGLYLTDLTFVNEGNMNTRPVPENLDNLPSSMVQSPLINFDKHVKTAKVLTDLQRFQIPYRLQEVVEIQTWIDSQVAKVRINGSTDTVKLYRKSLALEPKEPRFRQSQTDTLKQNENGGGRQGSPTKGLASRGGTGLPTVMEAGEAGGKSGMI